MEFIMDSLCGCKTVRILISWLHQQSADLVFKRDYGVLKNYANTTYYTYKAHCGMSLILDNS